MKKQPLSAPEVKNAAFTLGADLCGIAPAAAFSQAPEGFRPVDIYSKSTAVIIYAKRLPAEALYAESCIPYTQVNTLAVLAIDRLSFDLSLHLQDAGIQNVMIPGDDPFEHWEAERADVWSRYPGN